MNGKINNSINIAAIAAAKLAMYRLASLGGAYFFFTQSKMNKAENSIGRQSIVKTKAFQTNFIMNKGIACRMSVAVRSNWGGFVLFASAVSANPKYRG